MNYIPGGYEVDEEELLELELVIICFSSKIRIEMKTCV